MLKKHEMIIACNTIVTHYKYFCKLMINLFISYKIKIDDKIKIDFRKKLMIRQNLIIK